jgi:hypothetical protein
MVNVRKIGAIATGALFIGATIGMATAVTVPDTFKSSMLASAGVAKAQLVVGANAPGKTADTASAEVIQSAVKEKLGGAVGGDIQITYSVDDLDDGVNALDDDFSQVVLTNWAGDGDVMPLNVSLIFDANADGDLKDVSAGDDYNLYNVIYVIDASAGDVQFGYNVTEDAAWSDGDGVLEKGDRVKIKGTNYVITNPPSEDQNVEIGPATSKSLISATAVEPDQASVVSGEKKVLLYNGALYFYDGTSLVDGPFNITNVVVPYDLTNNLTSDAFNAYRVYVVANGTDSAKLNFVEKAQLTTISNDESGAIGYYSVKIDDPDFAGDDELVFLGDPISMVKGEKIDLPDTYYQLDFKIDKKFDIKRRKEITVASGTKLSTTVSKYDKFLNQTVTVTAIGGVAAEGPTLDIVDEETADKTMNLVLIGGPVANTLTAELVTAGKSTVDWYTSDGDIEVISGAFTTGKYAIIVAGKNREATKAAADALAAAL